MRTFIVALPLLAGLIAAPAFAEENLENSTSLKIKELALICESGRLTDMERRECRAMFKTADTDDKMLVVYKVFNERINGPSD